MSDLYQTSMTGVVKLVARDITGRVLVEATETVRNRPIYPFTISAGYREWIGPYSLGARITQVQS